MRTFAVVTTTHQSGFINYGLENVKSFVENWPVEIKMHVFLEDFTAENPCPSRVVYYDLHSEIPELYSLKKRNKDNKINADDERLKNIKSKPHKDKTYLYDYVRFSNKSYVMFYGIERIDADYIIWLDMDVRTHTKIPIRFIEKICPEDSMVSYLKREKTYTETGFLAFNKKHPKIKYYLQIAKDIYDNDKIYTIDYFKNGYTDCHVFDYTLEKMISMYGVKVNDLNIYKENSHPFINCELGLYMDHFKGEKRKKNKRSGIHEVKRNEISSKNSYWNKNNNNNNNISNTNVQSKKIPTNNVNINKQNNIIQNKNIQKNISQNINMNLKDKSILNREKILKNIEKFKKTNKK